MYLKVSNLDLQFTNDDLRNLFSSVGEVHSAEIAIDQFTDQSRGFGFVEMQTEEEGSKAIETLNKTEVGGRQISVEKAEPRLVQKGSYKIGSGTINAFRFRKT
ncbi:MAG TPA: RNA-binding protein [Chitinophagaceae bacterium]|jgi:RNA recognition motif-containing protein|nr:RNA-binding protein [Chitinophagaceae bacterium]